MLLRRPLSLNPTAGLLTEAPALLAAHEGNDFPLRSGSQAASLRSSRPRDKDLQRTSQEGRKQESVPAIATVPQASSHPVTSAKLTLPFRSRFRPRDKCLAGMLYARCSASTSLRTTAVSSSRDER